MNYSREVVEAVKSMAGKMVSAKIAERIGISENTVLNIAWLNHLNLACSYSVWSEQDIETLSELRDSGRKFTDIAEILNRSTESCKKKFYSIAGCNRTSRTVNAIRTINNMAGDYTAHEIGEKLHITAGRVQWLASKYKISLRMKNGRKRQWTVDDEAIMLMMYRDGSTKQEIADRLNRTVTAVYARKSRLKNDCAV